MPSGFDLDRLARVPFVASFDVSSRGDIAFAWNVSGQWQVYLLSPDGGGPRPLSEGRDSKLFPTWSRDGRRLAYAQDHEGDERYDIYACDPSTGDTLNLTPDTPDAIQPSVSWSPDGQRVAIVSNRGGRFQTYVVSADGRGAAQPLLDHPYSDLSAEWSPDGRWIAVSSLTVGQEVHTFPVPSDGGLPVPAGSVRRIGTPDGPIDAQPGEWSPDGRRLGFSSNVHGFRDVAIYDTQSGAIEWLTGGAHDCYGPSWSFDGDRVGYVVNRDGDHSLVVRNLSDGREREIAVGPGVHGGPAFTPDGRAVFSYNSPAHPNDLWACNLAGGEPQRLTDSLPPDVSREQFVAGEAVRYASTDGLEVPALLYRPRPAGGPAPAVVLVHGGPTAQYINTWDPLVQYLVSRGIVVLAPNYRGSTGYGRAFMEANRFDLGGGDLADVVAGAAFLVERGLADERRIAVSGGSYGGYLTMLALTKAPERWAAGSAVVPFVNWFTEYENEREDLQHWDRENMGDPVADADRYRDRSPIFFIDNVRAPVQLIAGAHDPRCPASEAEQVHAALKQRGVEAELVVYPDEGHGFRKTENRVDALLRRAAFLERCLAV